MLSADYPLKHTRLEQLYRAGFNIADFVCFPPNTLVGREKELESFLQKHGRISCRHFHENEKQHFKCPVLYDQTDWQTILAFCLDNNYGRNHEQTAFYTLCNEAIKLDDSTCAGNILVLNEDTFFVEFFYGPGTPRDIESKGVDELKLYSKSGYSPAEGEKPPTEVLSLVQRARKFRPLENKPYVIEFSVYPYPIGRNNGHTIVWEWRWGWLHYQLQANKFLLQINQTQSEEIKKLNKIIIQLEEEVQKSKTESRFVQEPF